MAQYIDQWHRRRGDAIREGAWHGNDTTWRMSLDLNRVIRFGKADGTLSDQPQRQLFSITDAVICGQGNGPLKPDPYFAGVISFSTSPAYADLFHSFVMGLDWQKLPIVREAFSQCRFPIEEGKPSELRVVFEGRSLGFGQLRDQFNDIARLGDGWGALFRNPIEQ